MGLISAVLGAPLAPIRGVIRLGELIQEQVEQQLHDPAEARRELEAIDAEADAGELSIDERREAEQRVLNRVTGQPADPDPQTAKPGSPERSDHP
ncbi:gas vesicle protein GvpG [Rhodococcus maanshanensis]|uniref:Gas vesicle protein G n=1 Tax=Rhodococcus maanshanensis TaxID=183556 RepID=A0A1H7LSJ9_9NOCA|nr:gas vesicle protein GvpG [Rhodococcus maanshanensis]SEL01455.1 Gas vesicle protein G [Rhodococcus maanshanensis]